MADTHPEMIAAVLQRFKSALARARQICSEPLAAVDVASLRMRVELARAHVLDHALAQRADGIGAHGNSPE
jgi:hypothetical protein